MSRIGKKEITIPEKTEVVFANGVLKVKGPKGEISKEFNPTIAIKVDGNTVTLSPVEETLATKSLWGTYASHVMNMIEGVNKAFTEKLILEGIGYKGEVSGDTLKLNLGFSHPINLKIPKDIKVTIEKALFTFTGHNKEELSQFASQIRSLKKPEPYKGKGFRYDGEIIRRKQGKKSV